MEIQFIKNFFKSILFFIRHIILFLLLNGILYFLFNSFLFDVLDRTFTVKLAKVINGKYLNPPMIFLIFVIITKIIVKLSFYTIALNNDFEDIKNDIMIYVGDFINNIYHIFISSYAFIFLGVLISAPIITGIFYFNYCIFFMIYVIARRKNSSEERYNPIETISKSFAITKGNRIKIFIVNTLIIISTLFLINQLPNEIIVNKVNINYLIKMLIFDFIILYLLKIGFVLDKIDNAKIEEAKQKEMEKQRDASKAFVTAKVR